MKRPRHPLSMALVAAFSCPPAATAAPAPAPLAARIPDAASRFCIDILSRAVALPSAPDEEAVLFARYGLSSGVPQPAMDRLGRAGQSLLSRAVLASGSASDGDFVIAIGGFSGQTCRIIVWRAPATTLFDVTTRAMQARDWTWRALPPVPQTPGMIRKAYVRRDGAGTPYLANVVAPVTPAPTAMFQLIVTVAPLPPAIALPEGH